MLFYCLISTTIWAQPKIYDPTRTEYFDYEGKEWQESKIKLPKYPKRGNLLEFSLDTPVAASYKFYLDSKSLSLGKDGVSRYTLVIESGTARNILYDGIRCTTAQYKNYAFGSGGAWQSAGSGLWSGIGDKSVLGARLYLFRNVVCDELHKSRKPKHIIRILRYN